MPRWPWSRDAQEAPSPEPQESASAPDAVGESVVAASPEPLATIPAVQRAPEVAATPEPTAPAEPRGLRSGGEIGDAMRGHDSAIKSMSPVGDMGGLRQTAWIFAEGERLANENESEIMAQRMVDRTAIRRSFEPDAFYDSLASLTSFREQGGFAEADGDLVLNDQFPATREATGTFPPMGSAATRGSASQAPSFPSAAAQRTASRAVDAKFSDPSAAPSPSSGLVVDQGTFAAPTPTPQAPPPRAVARWAADPPSPAPPVAPRAADTPRAPAPAPASDEPAIQRLADRESSPAPRAEAPDPGDEPAQAAVAPRAVVEPPRPTDAAPELTLPEPGPLPAGPSFEQAGSVQRRAAAEPAATPPLAAPTSIQQPPATPAPAGAAPAPAPVAAEGGSPVQSTTAAEPAAPPAVSQGDAAPSSTASPGEARPEADTAAGFSISTERGPATVQRTPAEPAMPSTTPTVEATPGGVAQAFDSPLDLNLPLSEATGAAEHALQRSPDRPSAGGASTSAAPVAGTPAPPVIERAPDPAAPQSSTAAPVAGTPAPPVIGRAPDHPAAPQSATAVTPSDVQRRTDAPDPLPPTGATVPAQPEQTASPGPDAPVQRVSVDAPETAAPVLTQEMPLVAPGADSGSGRESPRATDVLPGDPASPVQRSAPAANDAAPLPVPGQPEVPQVPPQAPPASPATQVTQPVADGAPFGAIAEPTVQRHAEDETPSPETPTETRPDIARAIAGPGGPAAASRELDLPLAESAGPRGESDGPTGPVRRSPESSSPMASSQSVAPGIIGASPAAAAPTTPSTQGPVAGDTVLRAVDPATATTPAAHVRGTTTTPPTPGEQPALSVRADATAGGTIARTPDLTFVTEHSSPDRGAEPRSAGERPSRSEADGLEPSPVDGSPTEAPIVRSVAPAPAMAEPSGGTVEPFDTELALHAPSTPDQPGFASGGMPPAATIPPAQTADIPPTPASPGAAPAAVPLQRAALPAEASAPPTSRQPAELTLTQPAVSRPGPESAGETPAQRAAQPGGGRIDRSPDQATPAARVETATTSAAAVPAVPASTSQASAAAEAGNASAVESAPIQRAVAQAGASADMPDLDLALLQTAEVGTPATFAPGTVPGAGGEAPEANPSAQRAMAEAGSPAGMPDLDLALPQQREPAPGGQAASPASAIMRAAEISPSGAARPEPVRATPASPAATTGVPAMDLAHQSPAQGSETGGPIRRRVEATGSGSSTTPVTPGAAITPVPPVIARPGPVSSEALVTGAGPLELSTALVRSIEPAEDETPRPEPVFASPGGTPSGQGPTLEFATALPGVAGGGPGAPESRTAASTSIARAIDRATAPAARPAPVQPHTASQPDRIEQPLFAPAAAQPAPGSPEQVMRAFSSTATSFGTGAAASESPRSSRPGDLEFVERTVSAPMEAFGAVTSVQREVTESGGGEPKELSQDQVRDLSEKVWQYVRRELRIERDRQRGRP